MATVTDLARGARYGSLTVVGQTDSDSRGKARWLCDCDCGKRVSIRGDDLRRGRQKSCGCSRQGAGGV